MATKRKFTDADLSDDEDLSPGKQVLPVANLPLNFDGVPVDGMQYLFTVRRDARKLPNFTRVANPYEIGEESVVEQADASPNPAHSRLPSEAWRTKFLWRFKNFRQNSLQSTTHAHAPALSSSRKVIPDKKERDLWWAFLRGRPSSEWDPPKQVKPPKQNRYSRGRDDRFGGGMRGFSVDYYSAESLYGSQEQMPVLSTSPGLWSPSTKPPAGSGSLSDSSTAMPIFSEIPVQPDTREEASVAVLRSEDSDPQPDAPPEPTPSLLQHIDHRYALHLLMYFTHWINLHFEQGPETSFQFTNAHARWIFVLLSHVEDYITADETSLLRNLARACLSLIEERERLRTRSSTDEGSSDGQTHMDERSCWMVVTAVAGIWGQRDLWMDAEAMLSTIGTSQE
ncbi:uncharacterized protein FIBRA_07792 [Fibroporia radiculosa]|uniref:Uncharacterized protein n=1 Tax=Fibroporia radiculosa TaxID=599839 RepID=J4GVL8_9APHY|nr:uncharacterized protein FIBRA_07792 [Fibroporia radiculosa]CCM05565.1 predicted protein [Fibroporia radiculosa]